MKEAEISLQIWIYIQSIFKVTPRGLFGDNLAWLGSLWKHLSELQRTGSALGTHSEVDQEEMESVATSWAPLEYFDAVMVAGSSCDASNGND